MPTKIVVPELGESIVEATVADWLKKEGEQVAVGEAVVELETDKVDLEVGAPMEGVLSRIEVQAGQDVKVGDVLGVIEELPDGGAPTTGQPGQASAQKETKSEEPSEEPLVEEKSIPEPGQEPAGEIEPPDRVTPVARRLAEEHGIDLSEIDTSGRGKRVTREDVERYIQMRSGKALPEAQPETTPEEPEGSKGQPISQKLPQPAALKEAKPALDGDGRRDERIRMTRRRRTIAQRLVEAQQTAAMLTTFNDVDMGAIMELRRRRKESFQERYGVKLGIMSFFVKATIGVLKAFPLLNAEIQGDEIVLKHYYDIGIAIGAEEGLVVPVLRDADQRTFAEIEIAINNFVQKSSEGNLSIEDLRGGTFSITNGGVYGSLLSTPILNPPQSGILGMHRIEERPVARDGQVAIRPMMYVALTYDHRIVDGREAVQFLARLKELIEDPEAMLLEG